MRWEAIGVTDHSCCCVEKRSGEGSRKTVKRLRNYLGEVIRVLGAGRGHGGCEK